MYDVIKIFKRFINDSDDKVFLLEGEWGVGKSFLIEELTSELKNDEKYRVIKLSLFGISNLNELKGSLLSKTNLFNGLKESKDKLEIIQKYIFFPIKDVIDFFNTDRYKPNLSVTDIIIIDDIERKDNKLTIEEIFGFIDHLKKDNTKIILIANENNIGDSFKGFKEKIVSYEYKLLKPTKNAIANILGEQLSSFLNMQYVINLRTILHLKRILNYIDLEINEENKELIKLIFYILNCIDNNLFDREQYIDKRINKEISLSDIVNSTIRGNEINDKKIKNDMHRKYNKKKDDDIFVEYFKEEYSNEFISVRDKSFNEAITKIFIALKTTKYNDISNLKFEMTRNKTNDFMLPLNDIFYSANSNKKVTEYLSLIKNAFEGEKYDLVSVYSCFSKLVCDYYWEYIESDLNNLSLYNEIINIYPKKISKLLIESNNDYSDIFENLSLTYTKIQSEKAKELLFLIINDVNILFFEKYNVVSIDSFNEIMECFNFINSELCGELRKNIDEDDFYVFACNIVQCMNELFKRDITREEWSICHKMFEFLKDFNLKRTEIIEFIDKLLLVENEKIKILKEQYFCN